MSVRPSSVLLAATVAALAAGCAERAEPATAGPTGRYEVTATVLESPDHGPQLCAAVAESLPPQCGGPDIVGWDWADVDDEESANGTTWGSYRVVGTWDGRRLTLTEPPGEPGEEPGVPEPDFSTPCPVPEGGWAVEDPSTATAAGRESAIAYANQQPDLGSVWLDSGAELADVLPDVPEQAVLNVSFTGDLDRHERELRARYGGPICVPQAERSQAELLALQQQVHEALGDDALGSSANGRRGVVEVMVTVVDDDIEQRVAEVDPDGLVELQGWLQPVE
jgi:hypothetical protein